MYDPYQSRRAQRRYYRDMRRYYRYKNPMRSLAGGIFILALILGFAFNGLWGGGGFLFLLFVGLAFAALFSASSSMSPRGIYGGLQGFIWLLGIGLCFLIGFWPWILLPVAVTIILGALFNPITMGLAGMGFLHMSQQQPAAQSLYQQPYPAPEQPGYEPYQQGYQGAAAPPPPMYQEGGQQYPATPQPKEQYEQPQVQYPEQELPPMEQHKYD